MAYSLIAAGKKCRCPPLATKMVRCGERSDVPIHDIGKARYKRCAAQVLKENHRVPTTPATAVCARLVLTRTGLRCNTFADKCSDICSFGSARCENDSAGH